MKIHLTCARCGFYCETAHPVEDYEFDGWTVDHNNLLDGFSRCDDCSIFLGL